MNKNCTAGYALICFTLGLTIIGTYVTIMCYGGSILPATPIIEPSASSLGLDFVKYSSQLGVIFFSALFIVFARQLPHFQSTLFVSSALVLCAGTGVLILSFYQNLLDPYLLSALCSFVTAGCYIFFIANYYILFALRLKINHIIICISLSLVFRLVFSVLIELLFSETAQTFYVTIAPLLAMLL